jgi:hypothetical protein
MFCYAGKIAKITKADEGKVPYKLDVDNGEWWWTDEMFDPVYRPEDEPLSAEDAIIAMVKGGETLYDKEGYRCSFHELRGDFIRRGNIDGDMTVMNKFTDLYRRPVKRTRDMTRWEILAWVGSEESRGWLVMYVGSGDWSPPQYYNYADLPEQYQRARLLPDHSGIDEDTIQGFEVEE